MGLFTIGNSIDVFRSSNGRAIQSLTVPVLPPASMTCVGIVVSDGSYNLLNADCGSLPFICEKGPGEYPSVYYLNIEVTVCVCV